MIFRFFMDIFRAILTVTRPFSDTVLDFFYRIFMGPTKVLPPIDNKILLLPAVELAEKIRKRQLKCETVITTYINRIKEVEPYINATTDQRFEEAIQEAKAIDQMIARGEKSEEDIARDTPLLGVPFSCKEAIGIKGLYQTCGLVRAKGRKAVEDGDTTAFYRKAGAIPLVSTNVPEMCMWWESANHIFGMSKNPYDNYRTVGGSSGGEGAIITAGGTLIGIGNDIAGSIRIPASFCGIYGHKPSRDLISNKGHWPADGEEFDQFVSTGPMCRYAQDLPLLVKVLSGENAGKVPFNQQVDFRNVRVYYVEEFPGYLLSATKDIKQAIRKSVKHFEDEFGIKPTKLKIDELAYAFYMWECKLLETGGPAFVTALENGKKINLVWELFKSMFRCSDHTLPAIYFALVDRREKDDFYHKCLEMYKDLSNKLEEVLEGDAILLVPTHAEPPPHYLLTIPKYPNIAYTCIFSILGYASTQIPTGLSNGLPIGIQAISLQYKDHLTLAAALELDKVFNGWIPPFPVTV